MTADLYSTFTGPSGPYTAPVCPSCGDEVDAPGDRCGRERCSDETERTMTETDKSGCYFCTYHYGVSDAARCPEHRDERTSASTG